MFVTFHIHDELNLNNNKLIGLPTPTTDQTTAAANVQFVTNSIESKTGTLFTSATDDFSDSTKIQTNSGMVVGDGVIRPAISSFNQNFATDETYDQSGTDANVVVDNTGAYVSDNSLGIGYVPTDTTVGGDGLAYKRQYLKTEGFDFSNATKIAVTTNFTTPPTVGYFTSPKAHMNNPLVFTGNTTIATSMFSKTYKDSNKNVWSFVFFNNTTTGSAVYSYKNGVSINANFSSSMITAQSDTSRRCISVTETDTNILVAYPILPTTYRITQINKTTNAVGSSIDFTQTSITNMQQVSILQNGNRLHILASVANGTTTKSIIYGFTDNFTNITVDANNYFIRYATPFIYGVRLVKMDSTKIGWCGFTASSANAVHFGIIDQTKSQFPHQFRTTPAAVTSGTTYPYNAVGCATFSSASGNGMGDMVYDESTSTFFLLWGVSSNANAQAARIGSAVDSQIPTVTPLTAAPFEDVGNRDLAIFLNKNSPTNNREFHVFFHNSTRLDVEYASVYVTNLNVFSIFKYETIYRQENATAGYVFNIDVVPREDTISQYQIPYDIYYNSCDISSITSNSFVFNIKKTEYKRGIVPQLSALIVNGTNSSRVIIESGVTYEWSISGQNKNDIKIIYEYFFPILSTNHNTSANSVKIQSFTIEQTQPLNTQTTSSFTSIPIITDRLIKTVNLTATQQNESSNGNSISWEVASLGDNWINVGSGTVTTLVGTSNNWKVTFNEGYQGSQLRVKATVVKGESANTLALVPKIDKYVAEVSNVVLQSELLPVQINIMKLGLQVGTWSASQRTGFTKMMIDTFSSSDGVTGMTPSNGVITGTGTVTSVAENTDGNIFPTQILVVDDMNSTGTITYEVKRNNGNWEQVTPNAVFTFQNGTPQTTNQVQIRATLTSATLAGWAYLYA